jgi:hypothetical protein
LRRLSCNSLADSGNLARFLRDLLRGYSLRVYATVTELPHNANGTPRISQYDNDKFCNCRGLQAQEIGEERPNPGELGNPSIEECR